MFDLPNYPDVFTTRHINCVSCKEKFAITEGISNSWVMRGEMPQTVNLHYETRREQRPVVPTSRQIQQPINGSLALPKSYELVNCPRCGADNRNWLALTVAGDVAFWRIWQQRFPGAFAAMAIATIFSLLALTMPSLIEISWAQSIILMVSILVATLIFINTITSDWEDHRHDVHIARILPKSRRLESVLWVRHTLFLLLAALILPIIFFSAGPIVVQEIVEIIDTMPKEEVEVTAKGISTEFDTQVNQSADEITAFGTELKESLENLPTDDIERLEHEIEGLSQEIEDTAVAAAENVSTFGTAGLDRLETNLDTQIEAVESARKSAVAKFMDEVMGSIRYLAIWCLLMGLSLVFTLMIMMPAMKAFAMRVDANLPPPVFYSVANMTRLVTWETRQALEISGDYYFSIQWMSVDRNETGGLNLVGLFRETPETDIFGQPIGTLVRAQKHSIQTDEWCRVQTVKIEDVLVPIAAKAPNRSVISPRLGSSASSPQPSSTPPTVSVPSNSPNPAPTPIVIGAQRA